MSSILSRALRVAALMTVLAVEVQTVALAEVPGEDEGLNAALAQAEHENMVRRANAGAATIVVQTPTAPATTASAPTAAPSTQPGG